MQQKLDMQEIHETKLVIELIQNLFQDKVRIITHQTYIQSVMCRQQIEIVIELGQNLF